MRTSRQIKAEIEERFGFFPPFFEPALETPDILENLWQQTLSAYVNNPIHPLFKEKLFAYLSRFCSIPYCIVCHSCALRPMKMSAHDVLKILDEPAPYDEIELREQISLLNTTNPLNAWPEKDSELEESIFACSVFIFLEPSRSEQCRAELRRVLGNVHYNRLIEFLSYVKTCHLWVEAHPEISYEADKRAIENLGPLLKEKPQLAEFFKNYNDKVVLESKKREERLKAAIDNIKTIDKILKESEERFRGTFEQAAVGIAHVAPDGRWLRVNQKICDIVGYSKEELLKLSFQDITHPDDLDADLEYARQVLAGKIKTYSMEKRYYRKDGSIVWINLTVSLVRETSGAPKYFISVVEDISDRKNAEMERDLLQNLSLAVSEAEDLKSAINTALRNICEVTEWRFGEAWVPNHDRTALEFVNVLDRWGEDIDKFIEFSKRFTFRPGKGLPGRVWATKKPEWVRDVSVNGEIYLRTNAALKTELRSGFGIPIIAGSEVIAVIVFYMHEAREKDRHLVDLVSSVAFQIGSVFQRKLAEDMLKESEARLRAFVNALPDIAFILDEKGRYVEVLAAVSAG